MSEHRLNLLQDENKVIKTREQTEKLFEKKWREDPEQFNPMRNAMGKERIRKTWELMNQFFSPKNLKAADLGCGYGVLANMLAENGAHVTALDITEEALRKTTEKKIPNLSIVRDYIPNSKLPDDTFDIVVSTDLICYLPHNQYRLYFSELARIIHPTGYCVCSSPLDIYSEDPAQTLISLAETEFDVEKWILSHHSYYIKLLNFFYTPSKFVEGYRDKYFREEEIKKRSELSKWWFKINSNQVLGVMWTVIYRFFNFLAHFLEQSNFSLKLLESICRFFSYNTGVSHIIFVGKRRPLISSKELKELPVVRKGKKQVWE